MKNSLPRTFSTARLRRAIDGTGRTDSSIARSAGIRPQELWRLLAGGKHDPRVSTVARVADAIGCTVDELLNSPG